MSRTDAHAPFDVRVTRRELTVVPVHRCRGRSCDLPDRTVGRRGRCYWQFTFTGTSVCSCWMCHWHRRPEDRRSAGRARLRDVARAWNGGDGEM